MISVISGLKGVADLCSVLNMEQLMCFSKMKAEFKDGYSPRESQA